jgi:TRAP-type uncharacterized transport system substrate-binding protein
MRTTCVLPAIASLFIGAVSASPMAQAQTRKPVIASYEEKVRDANDIAVSIVVSGMTCTCARFAEDIRNVVNDLRPGGVRVLPLLGVGGLQNVNDVLFLKNVDMGVVEEDNLRVLKQRDPRLYANIEQQVQYITRLYNSEFHVLARNDIKTVRDLRGKKVNFNLKDSQTEVTAEAIFNKLNVSVVRSNYDNDLAIRKVLDGELAAMIVLTGAPQSALSKLKADDGVHFLAFDESTMPGVAGKDIFNEYLPTELTHDQYPALIPEGTSVPTLGNRALLVAYAWPEGSARYNRIGKFVREFFGKIDQFHDAARHPKWKEVNIAAEMPGWTRFKPAAEWISENRAKMTASPSLPFSNKDVATLKPAFNQFISEYLASRGAESLSPSEREAMFGKFVQSLGASKPRQ